MEQFREATLHGGPVGGRKLALGSEYPRDQWPEYVCINRSVPAVLPAHYRHIAGGVYEHQGACAEFDHSPRYHVPRCPDCGAQILGHPSGGHRS